MNQLIIRLQSNGGGSNDILCGYKGFEYAFDFLIHIFLQH